MIPAIVAEWVELRSPQGHLICRIDKRRALLEWRRGKEQVIVDLVALLSTIEVEREGQRSQESVA